MLTLNANIQKIIFAHCKLCSFYKFIYSVSLTAILFSNTALAKNQGQRVPDEIESLGGHSLGFANSGVVASPDLSSVRSNPAMLAIERQYVVSAGYHWPSTGRDFYQAGAVDSKTSHIAAGMSYTSSQDDYSLFKGNVDPENTFPAMYDSPIRYRVAAGLAQAMKNLSLGIGGQYLEGYQPSKNSDSSLESNTYEVVKGATFSLGIAGLFTKNLRFGLSGENFANKKLKDLAPRTYRAGLAYSLISNITLHLDYSQRDRIAHETNAPTGDSLSRQTEEEKALKPEQLLVGSFSVRVQDMLRILGAFGEDISGSRRLFGAGVAVVNQNFSLSYLFGHPYLSDDLTHQAINLSMQVAL